MNKKGEIDFRSLEKALASLIEAIHSQPKKKLEQDGVIQRFEYTFDLCWKFIRRYLLAAGREKVSNSPKPLFRDALEEHLLEDVKPWFEFLEARNLATHSYDERKASQVYRLAKKFPPYGSKLLEKLKARCQE